MNINTIDNKKNYVSIKYHNGGYGSIDRFYTEIVKIYEDKIIYTKTWEINKRIETIKNDDEFDFFDDYNYKSDINLTIKKNDERFRNNLIEIMGYINKIKNNKTNDICDGPVYEIKYLYNGKSKLFKDLRDYENIHEIIMLVHYILNNNGISINLM